MSAALPTKLIFIENQNHCITVDILGLNIDYIYLIRKIHLQQYSIP